MTDTIVPQLTARFDELSQRLPDVVDVFVHLEPRQLQEN